MNEDAAEPRGKLQWGLAASAALHLAAGALLFLHFSPELPKPQELDAVKVELVQQPDEKPEAKQEEAARQEAAPEPKPEPPKEEKPPEPAKQEEAPPPPEPEKKEEPAKAEPPDPAQEAAARDAINGLPFEVLKPVFEFGDKDAGPKKAEAGNASTGEDREAQKSALDSSDDTPEPKAAEETTPAPKGIASPDNIELPKADFADQSPAPGGGKDESAPAAVVEPGSTEAKKTDDQSASETNEAEKPRDLKEAKTLFSQNDLGGMSATTAMSGIPRDVRISQLCTTELREQLRHSTPPFRPVLLPAYRVREGDVLDVRNGAFRTRTEWYDLDYRCEVDDNATKVISFGFRVGGAVPRDQWKARGFPEE